MSEEIPVGSPPAPPGRHAAPQGWYSDPIDRTQDRYWDGWQWSRNTRPTESVSAAPQAPGETNRPSGWAGQPGGWSGRPQQGGYAAPARADASDRATTTADGVPLAGWGWRALAAIIDLVLTGIVGSLLTLPFYQKLISAYTVWFRQAMDQAQRGISPSQPSAEDFAQYLTRSDTLAITVIASALGIAYFSLMWRLRSATLGQLACGLRVVPVDRGQPVDGRPPTISWGSAVLRSVIFVVPRQSFYLIIVVVANVLLPLWQPKRQALHDLAARTQVIRVR